MIFTTTTYQTSEGDVQNVACHRFQCRSPSEGSTTSNSSSGSLWSGDSNDQRAMAEATTTSSSIVPDEFICPITHEMMKHPLISRYGQVYERDAILKWLTKHQWTCPITRREMYPSDLVRHYALEYRLKVWHRSQQRSLSTKPLSPESSNNNHNHLNSDEGVGDASNDNDNNIATTHRRLLPTTKDNRPSQQHESHNYERNKGLMHSFLLRVKRRRSISTPAA